MQKLLDKIKVDSRNARRYRLYSSTFDRQCIELLNFENEKGIFDTELLQKIIYNGIKKYNTMPPEHFNTYEKAKNMLKTYTLVKGFISALTANQFMEIFPIAKEYTGTNDFFSTKKMVCLYGENELIGNRNVDNFLINYANEDIYAFLSKGLDIKINISMSSGEIDMFKVFIETIGCETLLKQLPLPSISSPKVVPLFKEKKDRKVSNQ